MHAFEYVAPRSLGEAVAVLASEGKRVRPFAGGTDILVELRRGQTEVDCLVDVKSISELNEMAYSPTDGLRIGAAVPCCRVNESRDARRLFPALIDATSIIGGVATQGRASLGGNLCNASPSGDTISAMMALEARAAIAGPRGRRDIPVSRFCTAPGQTVLTKGELVVSLRLPVPHPRSGACYVRFTPRNEMDLAVVGVGAAIEMMPDLATFSSARVALGGVAPTPVLAQTAAAYLTGKPVSEEAIARAAELAKEACSPITDVRGTAAQRRHLVGVLTRRALWGAIRRARGGRSDDSAR